MQIRRDVRELSVRIWHLAFGITRHGNRAPLRVVLFVATAVLVSSPASAQVDLSGIWGPLYHEDQPERIPGPSLGDYLGLPITDGARRFAESWDSARLSVPEHQCRVHTVPYIYRGPLRLRIWEERDPGDPAADRDHASHQHVRPVADDLDGWPSASISLRTPHLDGVFDRTVRRRHAGGEDDAHQAELVSAERPAAERPGDVDGILRSTRRRPDAHQHRRGPGVPDRAADQERELRAGGASPGRQLGVAVRVRLRRWTAPPRTCRTIFRVPIPTWPSSSSL